MQNSGENQFDCLKLTRDKVCSSFKQETIDSNYNHLKYVYVHVCMYIERERKGKERVEVRQREFLKIRFFKNCPETVIM